jgi:hypothetical protein
LANIAGPDFGSPINEQAKATDEADAAAAHSTAVPTYEAADRQLFLMPKIVFPVSHSPGLRASEGAGRLI